MSFKSSWHIAINMNPYLSLSGNIVNDLLKHQEKWAENMKFMIWARAWHWKMKNVVKSNEGNAFPWYICYYNNSLRSIFPVLLLNVNAEFSRWIQKIEQRYTSIMQQGFCIQISRANYNDVSHLRTKVRRSICHL